MLKGDWAYNLMLRKHCQIIEIKKIWSELVCKVWIPEEDTILIVSSSQLVPLEKVQASSNEAVTYIVSAAEEHGYTIYEALKKDQTNLIAREREKASYVFSARRNSIERIGLPEVRNYRLKLLEQEESSFYFQLENNSTVYPDLIPLLILRVEGGRQ